MLWRFNRFQKIGPGLEEGFERVTGNFEGEMVILAIDASLGIKRLN